MTDKEINEAVVRKLGYPEKFYLTKLPDYCHSIAVAWDVMEHISKNKLFALMCICPNGEWACKIEGHEMVVATTAPMALCLAFLKWVA